MEQLVESKGVPLIRPLQAPWETTGVSHGFFGRLGGAGRGPYASLNLSYLVGDRREAVEQNWRIVMESMPPGASIARLNQVHGIAIRTIDSSYAGERLEGDGLVTATPGIMLTILTADCVPIVLVDEEHRVAAAIHAGWRGVLGRIAAEAIRAMAAAGAAPERIRAALGPSIGPCCFEVDEELADKFRHQFVEASAHLRPGRPGKAYIDLRGMIRDQLEMAGAEAGSIANVGPCTRCHSDRFFSRRANGGIVTGLQLSYVGLNVRESKW